jgi:hypothetical protein
MIKKKAKKTAVKKAPMKRKAKSKKDLNPAEVLKDISLLVEGEAEKMARAVIDLGKTGQLAPVKYLFEMAHIFPPLTDGSQSTEDEDSLAKTLLNRLNIPDEPIVLDDEDEIIRMATLKSAAQVAVDGKETPGAKHESSKSEIDAGAEQNSEEPMVVRSIP